MYTPAPGLNFHQITVLYVNVISFPIIINFLVALYDDIEQCKNCWWLQVPIVRTGILPSPPFHLPAEEDAASLINPLN